VDVIVCRTQAEWDEVQAIPDEWNTGQFDSVDDRLNDLRTAQVSIPIYSDDSPEATTVKGLKRVHCDTELRRIDVRKDRFDENFDATTGFVVTDSTVERRFL